MWFVTDLLWIDKVSPFCCDAQSGRPTLILEKLYAKLDISKTLSIFQ